MPALQSFVDKVGPTVSASWLNIVDVLCTTVFGQASTTVSARAALCSDLPLEVANGGTAARSLPTARASLTSDAPWSIAQGGTGQTQAGQALLAALGLTQAVIGNILYPQTAAETAAGVTPVNYFYAPGVPERYGAVGDGVTSDQNSMVNCFAANANILLSAGKTYLITGIVIKTQGVRVSGQGGGIAPILKIASGGSFALQFVSPSGNGTQFATGFVGENFQIQSAASSNQMYGIWCNNASIQSLYNVQISLVGNTFVGVARNGSYGLLGFFQQDGAFVKCTFTSGSGANSDGVYLTGSIAANETPNNNTFLGCRAQSSGGWGVRNSLGDGNTWIGGKVQGNGSGGWLEDDDGSGSGTSNTLLLSMGFEAQAAGDDLRISISNHLTCRNVAFESTAVTNAINVTSFSPNLLFDGCFSFSAKPVLFNGTGTGIRWLENNLGFGAITTTLSNLLLESNFVSLFNGSPTVGQNIATDCSQGRYLQITLTGGNAFNISAPTNMSIGKIYTYEIVNLTGGIMGVITWNSVFHLAGAFSNPANSARRTISFIYGGQTFVEVGRASADIL